jgi:starvation-inducible DNA-binding protein
MKATTMQADIGLAAEQRQGITTLLSALLADEYVLYTKTRNFHWNVVGPEFHALHKFFEDQYSQLNKRVDDIAERIRALGFNAIGTLAECLEHTRLEEQPGQYPPAPDMLANLATDHEVIIRQLRKDVKACEEQYHDIGTTDFLTTLLEQHEKMAWMLRAFLQTDGA